MNTIAPGYTSDDPELARIVAVTQGMTFRHGVSMADAWRSERWLPWDAVVPGPDDLYPTGGSPQKWILVRAYAVSDNTYRAVLHCPDGMPGRPELQWVLAHGTQVGDIYQHGMNEYDSEQHLSWWGLDDDWRLLLGYPDPPTPTPAPPSTDWDDGR